MKNLFFFGTLAFAPLRDLVLGRQAPTEVARLPSHAVHRVVGRGFAIILPRMGAEAEGVLLRGATDEDIARLDFYEGGHGFERRQIRVIDAQGGAVDAEYFHTLTPLRPAEPWDAVAWQRDWAGIALETAADVMALRGARPVAELASRHFPMQVRAASRLRARQSAPAELRRASVPEDLKILRQSQPYANFFAVEEYDVRYRRFDGRMSDPINRAVFVSGDAVTVLPYDPARDRVMLIEQFRAGRLGRGDPQPWLLEAIAGRIDPGETPDEAARREAVEEAGLTLGPLMRVANYYPSPGAKTEYLYSYVALCDLPDGCEGVFGVEDEAEDIRGHLVPFDRLMALVTSGEIDNAPLLLTILWLQRERERLRKGGFTG